MVSPLRSVGILVLAIVIFSMFQIKYQVQNMVDDLSETKRQIKAEQKSIRVLKAEWSYLNHPDRLRMLANKYLDTKYILLSKIHHMDSTGSTSLASHDDYKRNYRGAKPIFSSFTAE